MAKKLEPKKPITKVAEVRKKRLSRKGGPLSPSKVAMLERRYKVVSMRTSGASYEEIAKTLGVGVHTVAEDLKVLMEETVAVTSETTEVARILQDRRLDKIVNAHLPFATEVHEVVVMDPVTGAPRIVKAAPSTASSQIVLQTEQRRSKLLGLDKPEEKHVKVTGIREYVGVRLDEV